MLAGQQDLAHVLQTLVQLVNSEGQGEESDRLDTLDALLAFMVDRKITEVASPTEADLAAVRDLRRQLRAVIVAPDEYVRMRLVNSLLARAPITPRLVDHDGLGLHLHYFPPYASLSDHLVADIAMALARILATGDGARLRVCARPGCARVFYDTTKNRSRIYCDSGTCGSRLHTAAYRVRQSHANSSA